MQLKKGFLIVLTTLLVGSYFQPQINESAANTDHSIPIVEEKTDLISIFVKDRSELDRLVDTDVDLAEHIHQKHGGYEVTAIVTPSELDTLKAKGYTTETISTKDEITSILTEREKTVKQQEEIMATVDNLTVLRANYFTNQSGSFLYVEAKSSAGVAASTALTASWDKGIGTEIGSGGSAALERLSDAGKYLYHSFMVPVDYRPDQVKISSNLGGFVTAKVTNWLGDGEPESEPHYVKDFIDHYMTPTELTERIEKLAEEFPELSEIIDLPNETNGYRRYAQQTLGSTTDTAVVITSNEYGHEGGNDISVEFKDPEKADSKLEVSVQDKTLSVSLATDKDGKLISTAKEVAAAINTNAKQLVSATTYRGNEGNGVVLAQEKMTLTDNLKAPEEEVSRDPFTVKALRIGKHRDGSKIGVLAYSQEHAREWVTPLVSIETAERLLRNYAHDEDTRKLVDNLDIFIVPSINPDGGHYSFFDYNWQRKNMTNHCNETYSDPGVRNNWGVDLNRNHSVGSYLDGYSGASANCTSAVFGGPEKTSEPEAKNLIWLAEQNENIKFAMNMHSYGGYFMWPPGAYKPETRETLPRPSAGEEAFFWQASEYILEEIQKHRGTVVLPSRTGPVPDVLYSAAGNSADVLWYNHGIYAWNFEVGADLWNAEENQWVPVGFQPEFEEGHEEALEFANGLIGMLEVAADFGRDAEAPASSLKPGSGKYKDTVEASFESSEPATIYYTLDGSKPTFESKKIMLRDLREDPETLTIKKTTTINWFAVDPSGNIENGYDPINDENGFNSEKLVIVEADHKISVDKLSGKDRILTAIEVSKGLYPEGFSSNHSDKTVVLATSDDFADALSSGPLAAKLGNAPILLTASDKLTAEAKAEIERLNTDKVVIAGGTMAVKPAVEQDLKKMGLEVDRLRGEDRYGTNMAIVGELGEVNGAFVTSGTSYPDALASAPIASANNWAIVLTQENELSKPAAKAVKNLSVNIVGGTGVVSNNVEKTLIAQNGKEHVTRTAGADRYGTLAALLKAYQTGTDTNTVLITTGENFPDALTASSLAARTNAPLILVSDEIDKQTAAFLDAYGKTTIIDHVKVIGGKVNQSSADKLVELIGE
ncbi:cell wall-binding repeat-containing protein [Rossellomorea vietnamensis]|uniref:cell wall-binding repeat-containing protein n=1 Tax=Rossellomorea vietnamensis TaxID=218284 RepID=UPI003CF9030D